jgi:hypothetical protein
MNTLENPNIEPKHYTDMVIAPNEYIKANDLSWNVASIVKYISRYKAKNGIEDLMKAKWYLEDLIKDEQEKLNNSSKS